MDLVIEDDVNSIQRKQAFHGNTGMEVGRIMIIIEQARFNQQTATDKTWNLYGIYPNVGITMP